MQDPTRIVVLISGNGSNLQALINACNEGPLQDCRIVHVISNRKTAYGLERAASAGIPTSYHNLAKYKKLFEAHPTTQATTKAREAYDSELANLVIAQAPRLVVAAGFMHILSPAFLRPLTERNIDAINLHPALPGAFNGIDAIERAQTAWLAGEIDRTGVMVHHIAEEVDMGEPVLVKDYQFRPQDRKIEDLKEAIHALEWKALVEAVYKMTRRCDPH